MGSAPTDTPTDTGTVDALYERPYPPGLQLAAPPTAAVLDALAEDLVWTRRSRHLALLLEVGAPPSTGPDAVADAVPDDVPDDVPDRDVATGELTWWLEGVAARLGQVRLDAVFGGRRPAGFSRLRVARSRPGPVPPPAAVRTVVTASATSIDFKQQLHDACRAATSAPAPDGPVAVELRLTVSRRRDWTALWRPALQALGPVLGVPDPERPYVADVARVTRLGLHRRLDDQVGPRVGVEVWWQPVTGAGRAPQPTIGRSSGSR